MVVADRPLLALARRARRGTVRSRSSGAPGRSRGHEHGRERFPSTAPRPRRAPTPAPPRPAGSRILAVGGQMRPQGAGADGEHDVVDRRPEPVLQRARRAMSSSAKATPGGPPRVTPRCRAPPGGSRRAEAVVHRDRPGAPPCADLAHRLEAPDGAAEEARERVGHQPRLRRQARRDPRWARLGHGAALGCQVEQLGQHLGAGHAVDDGMVDLGDQPDLARAIPSTRCISHGGCRG